MSTQQLEQLSTPNKSHDDERFTIVAGTPSYFDTFRDPDKHKNLGFFIRDDRMIRVLKEKGIKQFFQIQFQTFDLIDFECNVIARDRTGSGKTLAYTLPVFQRLREKRLFERSFDCKFLVILPTRELALQVTREIQSILYPEEHISVIAVYGGTELRPQIASIQKKCDVVVATPGRLCDLLDRKALSLANLQVLCLDQADQMLKLGFQKEIETVLKYLTSTCKQKVQKLLFSATIPKWVIEISEKFMKNSTIVDMVQDQPVKTSQTVQHLSLSYPAHKRYEILNDLIAVYCGSEGRAIIFSDTKREANEIMQKAKLKVNSQVLHGDIGQPQRQRTFKKFHSGNLKCLVATNVAARGLDIPCVDLIVQLHPPQNTDDYIHRSGRTGRAGKSGTCLIIYDYSERYLLKRVEKMARINFVEIGLPQKEDILKASIMDTVKAVKEVRPEVIEYFGDIAEQLIIEEGGVVALAKALAKLSGINEKIKQKSVVGSKQGYISYLVKTSNKSISQDILLSCLQQKLGLRRSDLRDIQQIGQKIIAFQLPETYRKEMKELVQSNYVQHEQCLMSFKIVTSVKMLTEENQNQVEEQDITQEEMERALSFKQNYQIYIAGLSKETQNYELMRAFKNQNIRVFNIKIISDDDGYSKGYAFAICANKNELDKAVALGTMSLNGRMLNIRLSNKNKS